MDVKTVPRPGVNPGESAILEQQMRLKEVAGEAMLSEKRPNVPGHEQTKRDPKKDDRSDVNGRESAPPGSGKESLNTLKHSTSA